MERLQPKTLGKWPLNLYHRTTQMGVAVSQPTPNRLCQYTRKDNETLKPYRINDKRRILAESSMARKGMETIDIGPREDALI